MKKTRGKKGALVSDDLGKWIIAIVVLVIILLGIYLLVKKGGSAIEFFKNWAGWR